MMKDILVHIPTERPIRPVIDASISLASGLGAHLDGLATGYVSTSAYVADGSAAASIAAFSAMEQEQAEARAIDDDLIRSRQKRPWPCCTAVDITRFGCY